jgi:hypothetical protein
MLSLIGGATSLSGQSAGVTAVNNEGWIDGIAVTSPQHYFSNGAYNWGNTGGVIHWVNARVANGNSPIAIPGNAFSNSSVFPGGVVRALSVVEYSLDEAPLLSK